MFVIRGGIENIMDEQFTERDFDFFDAPPALLRGNGPITSTAHASENLRQHFPFGGLVI